MIKEKAFFWPRLFYESLAPSERRLTSEKSVLKLQQANSHLWQALNIYDDFLDGAGTAPKLPEANRHFRKFLEIYYRLNLPSNFYCLFNKVMDDLDSANREESRGLIIKNNGIRSLKNLSRKSLALGLGPLAILSGGGEKMSGRRAEAVLNFFRYALAAKQLSDDARDWREDLKAGKITVANNFFGKKLSAGRASLIKKPDEETKLNLLFASKSAPILIDRIDKLSKLSRKEIKKSGLANTALLADAILLPLETGVGESRFFLSLLQSSA